MSLLFFRLMNTKPKDKATIAKPVVNYRQFTFKYLSPGIKTEGLNEIRRYWQGGPVSTYLV